VFPIGSITKQFTAASILQLAQRGQAFAERWFEPLLPRGAGRQEAITVQQLLGHNAGLPRNVGDVYALLPGDEYRRKAFAAPLDFPPGQHHRYSNSGYILLGQIVERVSGMPLGDYFDRHLFSPAGMRSTGYGSSRFQAPRSTGL
jgi:CubicO group peptidase (beta-lactamase class C family)